MYRQTDRTGSIYVADRGSVLETIGDREGVVMSDGTGPRQPAKEGANQNKGRRPPRAGAGIAIGVCLGAGVGVSLQNLALGIAIAIAFALAFELAFKKQRETEAG
jgi:hypothetical protein